MSQKCVRCHKAGKFLCSKCKQVSYCSTDCQKEHWRAGHRGQCGQLYSERTGIYKKERIIGVYSKEAENSKQEMDAWLFGGHKSDELFSIKDFKNFCEYEGSLVTPGFGLENLGNTCYLNSVLQVLTFTRPLSNYFLSSSNHKSCTHKDFSKKQIGEPFCPLCTLQETVQALLRPKLMGSIRPIPWILNISKFGEFSFFRQEDAHEFLRQCFDKLADREIELACLAEGKQKIVGLRAETTLIHSIFNGYFLNEVKCNRCSAVSTTFEPFMDISIGLAEGSSLEEALSEYTNLEHIDEGVWSCGSCEKKPSCQKQATVYKTPAVLTVHLKRFDYINNGVKIHKSIVFSETLKLKNLISDKSPELLQNPNSEFLYELYGVIVHYGENIFSGHYVTFVKVHNCWYLIDDTKITPVSASVVLKQAGYMLFYRKVFNEKVAAQEASQPIKVAEEIQISQQSLKSEVVVKTPKYSQYYRTDEKNNVLDVVVKIFTPLLMNLSETKFSMKSDLSTEISFDVKEVYHLGLNIPFPVDAKRSEVTFIHGVVYAILKIKQGSSSDEKQEESAHLQDLTIQKQTDSDWQQKLEETLGDPLPDLFESPETERKPKAAVPKERETATYSKLLSDTKQKSAPTGVSQPKKSALKKVGRNDKCPCGSGKKYKGCHGK